MLMLSSEKPKIGFGLRGQDALVEGPVRWKKEKILKKIKIVSKLICRMKFSLKVIDLKLWL